MKFSQDKNNETSAWKSFLTVFRILFAFLSIYFFVDVFVNKWGGYSYYMSFISFLPGLSLAYILWIALIFVMAIIVWLMTYGVVKLLPVSFQVVRFEHLFMGLLIAVLLRMAKTILFKNVFLGDLTGLNTLALLILLIFVVSGILFLLSSVIYKLLYGLDNGISLLVWFFILLALPALPLSFISRIHYDSVSIPVDCPKITNSLISPISVNKSASYPNIILVTLDSLTSVDMQSYGYHRSTTPFISEWSKDAVVFNESYSSSNWSTPAVMSIMTGQRVWTHGVWHRIWIFPVDGYNGYNFPNLLKDHGYDVFGFVQTEYIHPIALGIGESFSVKVRPHSMWTPKTWWFDKLSELFIRRPIPREMVFESNAIAQFINLFRPSMHVIETPSEAVYNGFLDCISRYNTEKRHRPFFAWLHVMPPHFPYLPPEPYLGFFGDDDKFISNNEQELLIYKTYSDNMQSDIDILRKRYDELILYSDKQFELFASRLSERIDMSNTIIILSADHGESFSHNFMGHVYENLYEDLVRVPLIVKMPGKGQGKRIDIPVENIDIAPTILKLAGIQVPDWMEGRSLLPLFDGEELELKPIFTMQFNENRSLGKLITKGTIAVRERNYKLIYYLGSGKKLLFDLAADPYEIKDLSWDEPLITEHLMELISDNLSKANAKIAAASLNK